jgi:N-acetyl-anhydromuramyl-L-alanine amidase AmpD
MTAWVEAAHHWSGREGQIPRFLILHGTAGFTRAADVAGFFARQTTEASAHYIVGLDGEVFQCVNEEDAAWANGPISGPSGASGDGVHHDSWWDSGINPNLLSISIEHVKPSQDNSDQLTPAQKLASFALIKDICSRWPIPMRQADAHGGITGHFSMDPVNRSRCPGPYPWSELWQFLQKGLQSMATIDTLPAGWIDDGKGTLKCGAFVVVRGFRDHVLAGLKDGSWNRDDVPCENEKEANPLEMSHESLGGGTRQRFKYTTLEWTKDLGVFPAYTGPELIKQEQMLAIQKSQIEVLAQQVASLKTQNAALMNGSTLAALEADMHKIFQIASAYEAVK